MEQIAEDAKQAAEDAKQAAHDAAAGIAGHAGKGKGKSTGRDKTSGGNITIGPGERWRDVVAIRGNIRMGPGSSARQVTAVLGSIDARARRHRRARGGVGGRQRAPRLRLARGSDAVAVGGEVVMEPGATVGGSRLR